MATVDEQRRTPDQLASVLSRGNSGSGGFEPLEWVQTHISHVFLGERRVLKLRKAVRLPFLDFGTRDARNADCCREFELNRRLAPTVYLGIAPLVDEKSSVSIGPVRQSLSDPEFEHVLVMRRLPAGRDALSLLDNHRLDPKLLESVAELLERFHASVRLGRPAPWSAKAWLERSIAPMLESVASIAESNLVPPRRVEAMDSRIRKRLTALEPWLEKRRLEGRAVDGHGDLHLDHVWFEEEEAEPILIDCLEFNEDLRRIDCASEVAFLAMDLRYRGRADLAEWFLASYAMRTDDYGLFTVVDFFAAYRALVRAKVAALAAFQPGIPDSQRGPARRSAERHFKLAEALLEPDSTPGLIVLCGTVGSGKTSVARHLAQSGSGILISSDRVRKSISEIPATTHISMSTDEGLYRPERTERVYQELLDRATFVVDSGRTAILDASFSKRLQRDVARGWAANRQIPARLIEVRCDSEVARNRLRERARVGTDPSDAGPDFLPISESRFESPDEWPSTDRRVVWTNHEHWKAEITPDCSRS